MKDQIITQDGEVYSYSKTGKTMPERGWTLTPDGWATVYVILAAAVGFGIAATAPKVAAAVTQITNHF